ncbi:MAG: hypothetical protein M3463_19510, partial [Verrucomicrobiota bacterium]|nr:hypothetical protein [Verrucomicrobiota bacterium]
PRVGVPPSGELARLRAELKASQESSQQLKAAGAEFTEQTAALRARTGVVETERDDLRSQLQKQAGLQAQCDSLSTNVEKLRAELHRTNTERDLGKAETERQTADFQKVRGILDLTLDRLEVEQGKLRQVAEQFAASERERVALQQRVGEPDLGPELLAVRGELASVEEKLREAQAQLETVRAERDQACLGRSDLEATLGSAIISLEAAHAEANRSREEAAESREGRARLQTQLDEARKDAGELQRELAQSREAMATAERERDEGQALLAERSRELAGAAALAESLRLQAANAERSRSQAGTELGEERIRLQTQLDQARGDVGELQKWVDRLLESLQARQRELEQTQETLARVERERNEGQALLAERSRELDSAAAVSGSLRSDLETLRAEHAAVQEERGTLKQQAREAAERANSMQKCLSDFNTEVKQQNAQRHAAQLAVGAARKQREERGKTGGRQTLGAFGVATPDPQSLSGAPASTLRQTVEAAEDAGRAGRGEHGGRSAPVEAAGGQIAATDDQLRLAKLECERARDELHAVEADRDSIRSELEAARKRLEASKQRVPTLPCCRRAALRWAAEPWR